MGCDVARYSGQKCSGGSVNPGQENFVAGKANADGIDATWACCNCGYDPSAEPPEASASCEDLPGWADSDGKTCDKTRYASQKCSDGSVKPGQEASVANKA